MSSPWCARPNLAVREVIRTLQFYTADLDFREDWLPLYNGRRTAVRNRR